MKNYLRQVPRLDRKISKTVQGSPLVAYIRRNYPLRCKFCPSSSPKEPLFVGRPSISDTIASQPLLGQLIKPREEVTLQGMVIIWTTK